ncbi:16S rRNA (guanine(966)-N(2))-methyltransferase RsmD [Sneathiella limimaris]|uniref:16S rRNA (guanine(966)-N(2))-methyltransferase RsmD n=1 Tax=Sneathiella limimaris TaxID=1964213 RepID=UPI00146BCD51|nr:16S rRNA (guanine(966)-N(2))-methyltransferase RsmD [Sneathiella limimaris]
MRIVGGTYKGKRLYLPEDKRIRPTADRTREALFNILAHNADFRLDTGPMPRGATVLDVFAGTGALGVEALSRGAAHVTFMDNHPDSLKLIKQNVALVGGQRNASILNRDGTFAGQSSKPMDLIMMDPPYKMNLAGPALESLQKGGWIGDKTVVALELAAKEPFEIPEGLNLLEERKYGAAKLLILKTV